MSGPVRLNPKSWVSPDMATRRLNKKNNSYAGGRRSQSCEPETMSISGKSPLTSPKRTAGLNGLKSKGRNKRPSSTTTIRSGQHATVCFLDKWPQTKCKVTFDTIF